MAQNRQKYDRQLRIWGEHGQAALEAASVCVLNCGPAGTEALKDLLLAGVKAATAVDGRLVAPRDLGNNFHVEVEALGQPLARTAASLLQELNESARAQFVEEAAETLIEANPAFFRDFTLVIATQIPERLLVKLDAICRENGIMLIVARTYGLIGLVRVSVEEHRVVESKPDNAVDDLRLHNPWPELLQFASQLDIETTDLAVHRHIPWAVLLLRQAQHWKKEHGGALPATPKERADFKAALAAQRLAEDEENYKEALASAFKVWAFPGISEEVRRILYDKAADVTATSPDFWVIVAALRGFVENEGEGDLPLDGAIPDMHSFTDLYVSLQRVYQARAEAHVDAVDRRVRSLLRSVGRDTHGIARATVKLYCKNARNLKVVRFCSLQEEYCSRGGSDLVRQLTAEDSSNASLYVLLRACDHFAATYNRYPGVFEGAPEEEDAARLKAMAASLQSELGGAAAPLPEDDVIGEVCRAGAGDLHAVGAVVGGVAAQEAIKLITGQFSPLPGTFLYNAMASTSSVFVF